MDSKNQGVFLKHHTMPNGTKTSRLISNERKQVMPYTNTVQLSEIPDEFHRLEVRDSSNNIMREVFNMVDVKSYSYKVNYNSGVVYFDPSHAGKTITFAYHGRGVELISASRVVSGNVVNGKTIEDLFAETLRATESMEKVKQTYTDLEKVYGEELSGSKEVTAKATELVNSANQLLEDIKDNVVLSNGSWYEDVSVDDKNLRTELDGLAYELKLMVAELNRYTVSLENEIDRLDHKKMNRGELINMSNLGNDVKQALTGGSVSVVGVKSIGEEEIKTRGVSEFSVEFLERVSNNMVDPYKLTSGYFIGDTYVNDNMFVTTNYIPVGELITYYRNNYLYVNCYNDSLKCVQSFYNDGHTFRIPNGKGIKYVRVSYFATDTTPMLCVSGKETQQYSRLAWKHPNLRIAQENITDSFKVSVNNLPQIPAEKLEGTTRSVLGINLFDKEDVNNVYGYIDENGEFQSGVWSICSDYIPIRGNVEYNHQTASWTGVYDADKKWITSLGGTHKTFPANARYCRIAVEASIADHEMFVEGSVQPSTYIPYRVVKFGAGYDVVSRSELNDVVGGTSKLSGLKWGAIGDSITEPYNSYVKVIADKCGMEYVNLGLSGRTWGSRGASMDAQYPPVCQMYRQTPSDVDLITIACGTNDYGQVPLGDINDTTEGTFYGALNIVCQGLYENYSGKIYAFISPIHRGDCDETIYYSYTEALENISQKWGIPVLNGLKNISLNPNVPKINKLYFFAEDALHPNAEGHEIMAKPIQGFLEGLV